MHPIREIFKEIYSTIFLVLLIKQYSSICLLLIIVFGATQFRQHILEIMYIGLEIFQLPSQIPDLIGHCFFLGKGLKLGGTLTFSIKGTQIAVCVCAGKRRFLKQRKWIITQKKKKTKSFFKLKNSTKNGKTRFTFKF